MRGLVARSSFVASVLWPVARMLNATAQSDQRESARDKPGPRASTANPI